MTRRDISTLLLGLGGLALAVISARTGVSFLVYGVALCAVAAVLLYAWGQLDPKWTPALVFLLGLAFLYQTTLLTDNLVGTDIHTEYYIYQRTLQSGWDWSYPHAYNSSIGVTLLAPDLTETLHIPGYWIFKAVFPFLFAFVPLILFHVYRKEFGEQIAFVAAVLFVTLPTYLLEMTGLPRQMLGELMLALCLWLIVLRPHGLLSTLFLLACFILLGFMFHYVMGPIISGFLLGTAGTLAAICVLRRWWRSLPPVRFPAYWILPPLVLAMAIGWWYYTQVAGGSVAHDLTGLVTWLERAVGKGPPPPIPTSSSMLEPAGSYFGRQEPLVRTALGLDFMDTDVVSKIFRILQFLVQASLLVGIVRLLFMRRKPSAEFLGFVASAVVMLAATVLLPRFSNIINATRFYHLALFSLAPVIVLGGVLLFRNLKVATVVLFVPYILVTTGTVFELAGESNIGSVTAPYSIALSGERIGAAGLYTDDDVVAAQWAQNKAEESGVTLLSDINGMLLLSQTEDPYTYVHQADNGSRYYRVLPMSQRDKVGVTSSELAYGWGYLPREGAAVLPDGALVLLTSQSTRSESVMFKPNWKVLNDSASGMRVRYSFEDVGLDSGWETVFQSGGAVVLRRTR